MYHIWKGLRSHYGVLNWHLSNVVMHYCMFWWFADCLTSMHMQGHMLIWSLNCNLMLLLLMAHDNYITGLTPVKLIRFRLPPQTLLSRKSGSLHYPLHCRNTVYFYRLIACIYFVWRKLAYGNLTATGSCFCDQGRKSWLPFCFESLCCFGKQDIVWSYTCLWGVVLQSDVHFGNWNVAQLSLINSNHCNTDRCMLKCMDHNH